MDNDLSGAVREIKISLKPNTEDSSIEVDFSGTTMQLESNYMLPYLLPEQLCYMHLEY